MEKLTIAFSVDGQPLTFDSESGPLRQYWFQYYAKSAFANDEGEDEEQKSASEIIPTLCLVTGEAGVPIARSHKPKILGYSQSFFRWVYSFFCERSPCIFVLWL